MLIYPRSKDIEALKALKSQETNLLSSSVSEDEEKLSNLLAIKQASWKNLPGSRAKIEQWANNTPGVMMSSDGPVLVDRR